MKLFALLLLVGFAAAYTPEWGWKSGMEYRFEYTGRMLTGIPALSTQYSGLGIQSEIMVIPQNNGKIAVQIRQPQFVRINQVLRADPDVESHHSTNWRKLLLPEMTSVPSEQMQYLTMPFTFQYGTNGEIQQFTVDQEEPVWCVNYKKALAALLQVKKDSTAWEIQENRLERPTSEPRSYWKVKEESVIGICDTTYQVNEIPTYLVKDKHEYQIPYPEACEEQKFYEVIRTVDRDNCEKSSTFSFARPGSFHCGTEGASMGNCPSMWTSSSSTRYITCKSKYNPGYLQIQTIVADNEMNYKFLGYKTESTVTGSLQVLKLKKIQQTSTFPTPQHPKLINSLMYEYTKNSFGQETAQNPLSGLSEQEIAQGLTSGRIPKNQMSGETIAKSSPRTFLSGLDQDQPISIQTIKTEIVRLITEVADDLKQSSERLTESQINMKLLTVARAFTMVPTAQELVDIYGSFETSSSNDQPSTKKQLFTDSLLMSGTPQAMDFFHLVAGEGRITKHELGHFLLWLPHNVITPTEHVLEALFKTVTCEFVKKDQNLYTLGLTSFATLLQSACISENRFTSYPTFVYGEFCSPQSDIVQQKFIPYLVQGVQQSENDERKNLYLLTLGLVQHKNVISELVPVIEGISSNPTELNRIIALYSLSNVGYKNPNLVIPTLLSVFTNPSESTEMRIGAFNALLRLNPATNVFHTIAAVTRQEPSMDSELLKTINMALYTLGHETVNENMSEGRRNLIAKCQMTSKLIKKVPGIIPTSGSVYTSEFLSQVGVGYEAQLNWIASTSSVLPKNTYFQLRYILQNYSFDFVNIGMRMSGSETIFEKLSEMMVDGSSSNIKQQIKQGLSDQWKNIIQKLNLKDRENEKMAGAFMVRLFDSGIFFRSFEQMSSQVITEKLSQILKNPSTPTGNDQINVQKSFDISPVQLLYPTDMGFPLVIEVHAPITVSFSGKYNYQLQKEKPTAAISGNAIFTSQVTGWAGTICPFTQEYVVTGVNEHSVAQLPGKIDFTFDTEKQQLKINLTPEAQQQVSVLHFHVLPYTVHQNIKTFQPMTKSTNMKPIKSSVPERRIEGTFGETLGLKFVSTIKTESRFTDFRSMVELFNMYKSPINMLLFGYTSPALSERMTPSIRKHIYTIHYNPQESSTRNIEFSIKVGCATKKQGQGIQYHQLKPVSQSEQVSSIESGVSGSPSVSTIVKKILPYKAVSESIESSSSVHSDRKQMLKQVLGGLQSDSSVGVTVSVSTILHGSRPRTFTYKWRSAFGQQKSSESGSIKQEWKAQLSTPSTQQICVDGHINVPILPIWNIDEIRTSMVSFDYKNQLGFGQTCKESTIVTTGTARTSHKQKEFSRQSPEGKQCQQLMQQQVLGGASSPVCEKARLQASTLDEVDFKTEYVNVPSYVKYYENNFVAIVKAYLWPYYSPSSSVESSAQSQLQNSYSTLTRVVFKQYSPSFDLIITRPQEVITFKNVHIPYPYDLFFPMKTSQSKNILTRTVEQITGQTSIQSCKLDANTLTTFDNKTIGFKPDQCQHLLTGDCSKFNRFGVTVRAVSEGSPKKEVEIYIQKTIIKLTPTTSSQRGPMVVVNGQNLEVPVKQQKTILSQDHTSSIKIASIYRSVDGVIVVKSPEYLLGELRFNGEQLEVLPSPLLKNKLCGICGDSNSQKQGDLSGPKKCVYSKPQLEIASYRIPSSSCPSLPSTIRSQLEKETQECSKYHVVPTKVSKSYKSATGKCTLLRHIIVQKPGQICISKVPVTQCGPSCKAEPQEIVEKKVPFTCLQQGRLADQYVQKVQQGKSMPELQNLEESFVSVLRQPRHCIHALAGISRY